MLESLKIETGLKRTFILTKSRQDSANPHNLVKICLSGLHPSLKISIFNILIQCSIVKHTYWINTLLSASRALCKQKHFSDREGFKVSYDAAQRLEMKALQHSTVKS